MKILDSFTHALFVIGRRDNLQVFFKVHALLKNQ